MNKNASAFDLDSGSDSGSGSDYENENENDLIKSYIESIKKNDKNCIKSEIKLAKCYKYGSKGVDKNVVEAFKLYKSAAIKGNDIAQFELSHLYDNGIGTIPSESETFKW